MAKQTVNLGTSANKGDGDPLRTAFDKVNDNFDELYARDVYTDFSASVFGDDSTLLVDAVNNIIPSSVISGTEATNWNTAFGWGDHSVVGYLTAETNDLSSVVTWANVPDANITESSVTQHQTALSITESQITDLAHYDDTALATRVTTLENAGYITSETDSQELTLVGTDLSISSGNTVDLSGFLTSVPAQTFASLTGTPTTIAGYGITDALALGTTSTTALAGDTALFSGDYDDLSNKPTIPTAYTDSDVDIHLQSSIAADGEVLTWNLSNNEYTWLRPSADFADITNKPTTLAGYGITDGGGGGGGSQSRSTATGTTSSLADAAQADLDITGFKSYALLTITTDRAARVRLYVSAATRTADASRAEGVDPTSDAGLIAEVITTGADTVIISPGAYGFNLESSPTTTIPCRVTNKSGGTSTVQVDLNILQLEA